MRPRFLRLEAIIQGERHTAISTVIDVIGKTGGWIVSHTLLSDSMAVINFILPANGARHLVEALSTANIRATTQTEMPNRSSDQELNGQLTLTFANSSGNLRHDVPAVG